jgi:hypothetical protein
MAYIGQEIKGGTFKVLDTSGNTYNGSNTTFSLGTQVGAAAQLLVSHDGVIQKPGTDYTLASGGASITFSTAPASGASIFIVEISGAVGGTITPADNSVGITQLNVSDGSNGQVLQTNGSGTLSFSTPSSFDADGAQVFNESGASVDFRVESNTDANCFIVDGSGDKVGMGLAVPEGKLHIFTADASVGPNADADELVIENGTSGAGVGISLLSATNGEGRIVFGDSGDDNIGQIFYNHGDNSMRFHTAGAERMHLHNTGILAIGTATVQGSPNTSCLELKGTEAPLSIVNETATDSSDRTSIALRQANGTLVGNVGVDSSSTVFNTSSDYRLKENEAAISDGITRIKQLKPYKFNFKIQPDKTVDGFFAHEVSSIVPEAITGEKDGNETLQKVVINSSGSVIAFNVEQSDWTQGKTDGIYANDTTWEASKVIMKPQSIDQSKLVPLLTAALQEAITEIESLKARVTTLEG